MVQKLSGCKKSAKWLCNTNLLVLRYDNGKMAPQELPGIIVLNNLGCISDTSSIQGVTPPL